MSRIRRSREEAAELRVQPVSEVTPSRRDFSQYVAASKDEPAVIARVSRAATGWSREQLVAYAVACDDAEVAAVSLSSLDDLTAEDITAISAAVTAPILRDDPLVDVNQLYRSRLCGVDAVVLPAEELDAGELERLVDIAVSTHMAVVIECTRAASGEAALGWPYAIVGAPSANAGRELAKVLPPARTMILLEPIASPQQYDEARGVFDAVVVAPEVLGVDDVEGAITALRARS